MTMNNAQNYIFSVALTLSLCGRPFFPDLEQSNVWKRLTDAGFIRYIERASEDDLQSPVF